MRILFVYPNLYTQMGFNHGLASLSAVLKERGHETRLVNLNENLPPTPSEDDVFALVRAWEPGLIAFSCLSQQYRAGLGIARSLRARAAREGLALPPLVVGGVHPTMVPEDVISTNVMMAIRISGIGSPPNDSANTSLELGHGTVVDSRTVM